MQVQHLGTDLDEIVANSKNQENAVKLTFENLSYEIKIQLSRAEARKPGAKNTKKIIKDCSGYALPGQTLYIMGSSGAGKTSLLNILSDRIKRKGGVKLTGEVMMNDTTPLT